MDKSVLSFFYTLRDKEGNVLDQSPPEAPVAFLEGSHMIIEGLEQGLLGMNAGEKDEILVRPEKGYGFRDESQVDIVSRSKLPVEEISVGDYFQAGDDAQAPVVQVVAIDGDDVTLDANHPLAGKDLIFTVELVGRRAATQDELDHGHVHSSGGCCGDHEGGCGCH